MIQDEPAVTEFRSRAEHYCALFGGEQFPEPVDLLRELRVLLPRLYADGASLPVTEGTDSCNDELGPTTADVSALYKRLGAHLGGRGRYWEIYDPSLDPSDEVVAGSLPDDLSDIWNDLARGLAFWDRGSFEDAVWNWRFHWGVHWGAHAADAIRAIHWHLYQLGDR